MRKHFRKIVIKEGMQLAELMLLSVGREDRLTTAHVVTAYRLGHWNGFLAGLAIAVPITILLGMLFEWLRR